MRRIIGFLLIVFLSQSAGPIAAAEDKAQVWLYSKEIQLTGAQDYTAVYLDQDIYAHAQSSLQDLRVVDSSGEQVPYYLMQGNISSENITREYPSTLLQTFITNTSTNSDFIIDSLPNQDVLLNRMILKINSPYYFFNTQVWGSHDNLNWTLIDTFRVYKVDDAEKSMIEFGQALKYPYYRITLLNNVQKLRLTGLNAQYSEKVERYQQYARNISLAYSSSQEQRSTKIMISNPKLLHIQTLHLKTTGNFYRKYRLQGMISNKANDIANGTINATRINDEIAENTDITLPPGISPYSEYYLIIDDQDDKSIHIDAIEGVYLADKLVFPSRPGEAYKLAYGNADVKKPVYDIENYKSQIEKGSLNEGTLGPETVTIISQADNRFEKYKSIIFNTFIILTAILLAGIIVRKLRNDKPVGQ